MKQSIGKNKETNQLKKDELSALIKDMIFAGSFLSGEKLPSERELASYFSVSRPAIHDALLKVQADGLIKMRPRHGCVVKDFSSLASMSLLNELYLNNRLVDPKKIESGLVEFRQMILEKVIKKIILKTKSLSKKEKDFFFNSLEDLIEFSANKNMDDAGFSDTEYNSKIDSIVSEDFQFYCNLIALSEEEVFLIFFKMAKTIFIHQLKKFLNENKFYIKMISKYKREFVKTLKSGNNEEAIKIMMILTQPETYRKEINSKFTVED